MESEAIRMASGAAPVPPRYVDVMSKGQPRIAGRPATISLEEQPRKVLSCIRLGTPIIDG